LQRRLELTQMQRFIGSDRPGQGALAGWTLPRLGKSTATVVLDAGESQ
jgi:hypothetical protein